MTSQLKRTDARPKILHLITNLSVGGAENHLKILLGGLNTSRYEIEVAFFKTDSNSRLMAGDFRDLGFKVHDLKGRGRLNPAALTRLFKLVHRERYDILHSHLFRADLFGAAASLFSPNTRVLNSVHNPEDFYAKWWVAALAKLAARRQVGTIVISRAVGDYLGQHLRLPESKRHLVYYGHTPAPRTGLDVRAKYGIPQDAPLIGTVGRLAKQKGHIHLIKAMARVCRQVPQARLLIVGRDDQGIGQKLTVEAARLGLIRNIVLAGFRQEIADFMAAFDVFCLPSLWEGFGLVLLEAMAESRPVVATRAGSIPEVVSEGRTGLLVEPGDETGLAKALIEVLNDPQLGEKLGRAGKKRLETYFSVEAMVKGTEALYDRLLAENGFRAGQTAGQTDAPG